MFDFQLPVYVMRAYEKISTEGDFTVITTAFDRYVLDKPSLPGNYAQRRLFLFAESSKLPYKLYPLRRQIRYLSQMVGSGKSDFIDSTGRVFKWRKSKFYQIETARVLVCNQIFNGKFQAYVKNVPYPFVLSEPAEYISYMLVNGSPVVYGVYDEEPETPRLRVKI